jgi:hypothetical protein
MLLLGFNYLSIVPLSAKLRIYKSKHNKLMYTGCKNIMSDLW